MLDVYSPSDVMPVPCGGEDQASVPVPCKGSLLRLLGCLSEPAKQVTVVEDDCDIYNDDDVTWHVATRVQPDRDYVIMAKGTGLPLDPSMPKEEAIYSGKVGIDATRKHHYPPRSMPPKEMLQSVKDGWSSYGLPPLT